MERCAYAAVVDRETLVQLLATAGEAGRACRQALAADAYFEIWPELVETLPLTRTYQRRARLTRRKNVLPLGFDEALTQLKACELQHLILGIVRSTEPAYHFQLPCLPTRHAWWLVSGVSCNHQWRADLQNILRKWQWDG